VADDPLADLLDLPGVAEALAAARERIDDALRHPALRRDSWLGAPPGTSAVGPPGTSAVGPPGTPAGPGGGSPARVTAEVSRVAAEVSLRSAVASAALSGYAYPLADVRAGTVTDPGVQGALRVATAVPGLAATWPVAPGQVLARVHLLAARGLVSDDELGRPLPARPALKIVLNRVAQLSAGDSPPSPILLAALIHAELLALRAFAGPNGVVARAAARLILISSGVDPRGLIAVDVGHQQREREYVATANAWPSGEPESVPAWLRHYGAALAAGADETRSIAETMS
jgi:hypothetical protein